MKEKILNSVVYVVLPFWLAYLLIKNGIKNKFILDYIILAWQCQKSKLQIKFGLCETFTGDELKELFK